MSDKITQFSPPPIPQYKLWMDMLNITACLSVVLLHCNHDVKCQDHASLYLLYGIAVYTLFYWPVPIFLMLSFCNNVNYKNGVKAFYKRRFRRVVIPYLIWSLLYSFFCIFYLKQDFTFREYVFNFMNGQFNGNMWFFIPLFALYLSIPFLRVLINHCSCKSLLYFVILGFTCNSLLPWVCKNIGMESPNLFPLGGSFIMVCIAGYLILINELSKKQRYLIYAIGVLTALLHYVLIYYHTVSDAKFYMEGLDYYAPYSVVVPIAVFLWFKNINWYSVLNVLKVKVSFIRKLSSYSFGVYLLHWGVKEVCYDIGIPCKNYFFGFILTYIICILIMKALKLVPGSKYIFP